MKSIIHTTRNQLKGYGANYYQARTLTKSLRPIERVGRTNLYSLQEVIDFLKKYLDKPKISPKTRQSLIALLPLLIKQLDNIAPAVFTKPVDRELGQLTKELFLKNIDLDRKIARSQAKIATIKGKQIK